MNWYVSLSAEEGLTDDLADRCPHVEADPSLAVRTLGEQDSFGPVHRYVVCAACSAQAHAQRMEEKYTCEDCGKAFPLKDGIRWRWYDFYEAQGDEALPICNACRVLPKHRDRMKRDAAAAQAEADLYGSDD